MPGPSGTVWHFRLRRTKNLVVQARLYSRFGIAIEMMLWRPQHPGYAWLNSYWVVIARADGACDAPLYRI